MHNFLLRLNLIKKITIFLVLIFLIVVICAMRKQTKNKLKFKLFEEIPFFLVNLVYNKA